MLLARAVEHLRYGLRETPHDVLELRQFQVLLVQAVAAGAEQGGVRLGPAHHLEQ